MVITFVIVITLNIDSQICVIFWSVGSVKSRPGWLIKKLPSFIIMQETFNYDDSDLMSSSSFMDD